MVLRRSLVVLVLFIACVVLAVCSFTAFARPEALSVLSGAEFVAENELLVMYILPDTTEVVVYDKREDRLWCSSPIDRRTQEKVAGGRELNRLGAALTIGYYTPGDQLKTMDTANDSVSYGQFDMVPITDGVRVEYVLGAQFKELDLLPRLVPKDFFEDQILSGLSTSDQGTLLRYYQEISLVELAETERVDVHGVDKQALFGDSTLTVVGQQIRAEDKRDLIRYSLTMIRDNRSDRQALADLVAADIEFLRHGAFYILSERTPAFMHRNFVGIVRKAGVDMDDINDIRQLVGFDPILPDFEAFSIAIEYRLEGESLVVRVPADGIQYPEDVVDWAGRYGRAGRLVTLPLHSISVLEFFAAAQEGQDGYIFVPDGSGAIIRLNRDKRYAQPFNSPVYGADNSLAPRNELLGYPERIHLPVFGMKQGDQSFLAIIEDGDAMARIRADVAGRKYSYSTVFSEYIVTPVGQASLTADVTQSLSTGRTKTTMNVYQSRAYQGDIQVRYLFLYGDQADYVAMAHEYQNYLIENGVLKPSGESEAFPFFVELVGGVTVRRPILGVSREVVEPMTTFQQAGKIICDLGELRQAEIGVRFSGWMSGGIAHSFPSEIRLEAALGKEGDVSLLQEMVCETGSSLYMDVNMVTVATDRLFDSFSASRDASRLLDRRVARVYEYDMASYAHIPGSGEYVLSPARLVGLMEAFLGDYRSLGIEGLSLRNMEQLNSDFRDDSSTLVDRQMALETLTGALKLASSGHDLMIDGGNAYLLPFAECILNIPLRSSDYRIVDESVPFMPIVLHGFIPYAGGPVNLSDDPVRHLLKSIETGAYPYYLLSHSPSSAVKGSDYDHLYATQYDQWRDQLRSVYLLYCELYGGESSQRITEHSRVSEGVYCTAFSDGRMIYVNYGTDPVEIDGVVVGGLDYLLLRGEESGL